MSDLIFVRLRLTRCGLDVGINRAWMSDSPFHEKAGLCQVILWLSKFISDVFLCRIGCFLAGEAAVKGRAQRVHLEP